MTSWDANRGLSISKFLNFIIVLLKIINSWFLVFLFSVPFRHGERIGFSYLVSQKYTGDDAQVKVLRKSKILEFKIKLNAHKRLIPAHIKGKPPSYYIVGGFVFSAVSVPYLRSEVCNQLHYLRFYLLLLVHDSESLHILVQSLFL